MSVPAGSALVAGATGLVGSQLLTRLLAMRSYARVLVLSRRPIDLTGPGVEVHVLDFARLHTLQLGTSVDDVYCALGTTMKIAGSEEAFKRVDHDHVLAVARLGLACGARRFVLVSSVGADAGSGNFYLRIKGEVERAVAGLGFDTVDILRPGLLLGARDAHRPLERAGALAMSLLNPVLAGPLARYRAIDAGVVAAAMLGAARQPGSGARIHQGRDLERLASTS